MKFRLSKLVLLLAVSAADVAFGRGESWLAKPPPPPPVATLTNEARYVEWKFREDVTDPSTGLGTALYAPPAAIEAMLPLVDMWLPDYKADDDALHRKYTGVTNTVVKRNLERLVAAKAKLEVRCLVVPGCTDGADIVNRHRYLASLGIGEKQIVDLEYHDYARSKYLDLGMTDTMPPKN